MMAGNTTVMASRMTQFQYSPTGGASGDRQSRSGEGNSAEALDDPELKSSPDGLNLFEIDDFRKFDTKPTIGAEAFSDLGTHLGARLKALGLSDKVSMQVAAAITDPDRGREMAGAEGAFFGRRLLIQIAYTGLDKAEGVLNHEALHAMRDLGRFDEKEWAVLSLAAAGNAAQLADVRQRYRGHGLSEEAFGLS